MNQINWSVQIQREQILHEPLFIRFEIILDFETPPQPQDLRYGPDQQFLHLCTFEEFRIYDLVRIDFNTAVSWSRNIGIWTYALSGVTSGSRNIGIWSLAWSNITTGSNNVMIGSGVQISNATWSDQLNISNWIYGSGGKIGIGTGALATTAILKVAGQIEITWWTPGVGKILMSDANGLASWTNSISSATATGITWGTQNYLPKFWTGWTWLYISQIIDTWTWVWLGATWWAINTKLVIDSWIDDNLGLRFSRLDVHWLLYC